jgi:hypothetical protein
MDKKRILNKTIGPNETRDGRRLPEEKEEQVGGKGAGGWLIRILEAEVNYRKGQIRCNTTCRYLIHGRCPHYWAADLCPYQVRVIRALMRLAKKEGAEDFKRRASGN